MMFVNQLNVNYMILWWWIEPGYSDTE